MKDLSLNSATTLNPRAKPVFVNSQYYLVDLYWGEGMNNFDSLVVNLFLWKGSLYQSSSKSSMKTNLDLAHINLNSAVFL